MTAPAGRRTFGAAFALLADPAGGNGSCTIPRQMFRGWSLTLGRVRGVPIRAHWTLLLVLPYLAFLFGARFAAIARMSGVDPEAVELPPLVWGALVAVGLFASVAVHELAHTALALRAGGRVREITLMLLGGVSQLEHLPRKPRTEAVMAAAGPATSLALGALLLLSLELPLPPDLRLGAFYLGQLNLILGIFNLLPAFPLDGGRVLRGLLAGRMGALRATRVAATVGKVSAVALALLGLGSGNLLLLLIALFVYSGADVEKRAEEQRDVLADLRVAQVMSVHPPVVHVDETLDRVRERMREQARLEAIVLDDDGEPMGIVEASDLAGLRPDRLGQLRVADLGPRLAKRAVVLPSWARATTALDRAAELGAEYVVVAEGSQVLGWVGRRELETTLVLRSLGEARRRPLPPLPPARPWPPPARPWPPPA